MTPKEAWNGLLDDIKLLSVLPIEKKRELLNRLDVLRPLIIFPTEKEMCDLLSEEVDDDVILFNDEDFVAVGKGRVIVSKFSNGEILTQVSLPPHLITMIGKFYESLEGENEQTKKD